MPTENGPKFVKVGSLMMPVVKPTFQEEHGLAPHYLQETNATYERKKIAMKQLK